MRDKDLLKQLQQNDWEIDRIKGSHHILKKGDKTLVLPMHGKDIPNGLLSALLKQAGFK